MPKIHYPPETATNEEINYSKLAIKFSTTLTRDMLFAGIRDILKKIGDFVDRVYEFEVDFTFGTLKSKERRVKFTFNNKRLNEILPESMTRDLASKALGYTMKEVDNTADTSDFLAPLTVQSVTNFYANPPSAELHEQYQITNKKGNMNKRPSTTSSTFNGFGNSYRKSDNRDESYSRPNTENDMFKDSIIEISDDNDNNYHNNNNNPSQQIEDKKEDTSKKVVVPNLRFQNIGKDNIPQPIVSPGCAELLRAMEIKEMDLPTKAERSRIARQDVARQAFRRCLQTVEHASNTNDYMDFQIQKMEEAAVAKDKIKKEKLQKELADLREHLKSQMEYANAKKQEDKKDRKMAKINVALPSQLAVPDRATLQARKEALLKELDKQIMLKNTIIADKKQIKLAEERMFLDQIARENDLDVIKRRVEHLEKQRDLLDAWEKEAHINNLKKLELKGTNSVQEYLSASQLFDITQDKDIGSKSTFQMSRIGYDARSSSRK
jgi:hypothetical protein